MPPPGLDLQQAARDHLWLHFTRMGGTATARSRSSSAATAATSRTRTASATSTRSPACSPCRSATRTARRWARRRSRRCASCRSTPTGRTRTRARSSSRTSSPTLAPGDLNRVFFVSGGSEAVESAWKLARQYHAARGERRWKVDRAAARLPRDDDGRALDQRHRGAAHAVRAARPGRRSHVRNTNRYHRPPDETEAEFTAFLLDELEQAIEQAGPEHGRDGDHGAGAERRAAPSRRPRATSRACASSATATGSCSAPTR